MDFSIFDSFDMSVFTFFGEQIQSAFMNVVAEFITFFGGSEFVIPMAVAGAIMIPFKKTRKFGMAVLFAVLVGTLLTNLVMKPLFARPRPYIYYADNPIFMAWHEFAGGHLESEKSFPSGHTTAAFELGVAIFLVMKNKKIAWIFPVFSALVGLSRIYLMVHYVTDVIGGVFVGVFAGIMGYLIMKAIIEKTKNTKFAEFDLAEKIKKKA
ncbi:MAG: phosphatase PAP2 family protein [Clostridia bacterium]|nr:phosphatase PAP2 family protein [Clostridia bacterium]